MKAKTKTAPATTTNNQYLQSSRRIMSPSDSTPIIHKPNLITIAQDKTPIDDGEIIALMEHDKPDNLEVDDDAVDRADETPSCNSKTSDIHTDDHIIPMASEYNLQQDDIPTSLHQQAEWIDPFPTPCNSIGTSSRSHSPLHRNAVNVFHPEFYTPHNRTAAKSSTRSFDVPYLQGSSFQTPVKTNGDWLDPFPTPDASVHSLKCDPFPIRDHSRDDAYDWSNFEVPPLPCIHNESSSEKHRRCAADIRPSHRSAPLLMNCDPPPIRRISSETGLFGRVPSIDDCLKTIIANVGPDGNDLLLNDAAANTTSHDNGNDEKPSRHNSLHRNHSHDNVLTSSLQQNPQSNMNIANNMFHRQQSKDDLHLLHTTNTTIVNSNTFPKSTRLSPLLTPVRNLLAEQGRKATKVYRANSQRIRRKLRERRERRRQQQREPPASWWIVIPADHPYKIIWDLLTMVWALLGAYRTHLRIRDRVFDQSPLIVLTEVWFTLDILLNFVTEHKTSKGQVIRDGKTVWARYLTTWFVIDLLSLIPWERIYVRPVVERIKRRNIFQKTFFRSKAVVRVSRVLRGRHIKLIGQVSKQTGTPLRRFVGLLIKYVPKYLLFIRHMKGALFVRGLRFVHWLHNMYKKIWVSAQHAGRTVARKSISFRRRRRHPIFELAQEEGEENGGDDKQMDHEESDTDDGDDETEEDDEDDISTNFNYDFDISESMDISEGGDYGQNSSHLYQRSRSENAAALRRRTFSEM
jgi:hypothetical protein